MNDKTETVIKAPSRPDEAVYTYKGYYIAVGWHDRLRRCVYVNFGEGERQFTKDYEAIMLYLNPNNSGPISTPDIAAKVQKHVSDRGGETDILQPLIDAAINRITDIIEVENLKATLASILYRDYPYMSSAVVHHITSLANMDAWGDGGFALLAQFRKD